MRAEAVRAEAGNFALKLRIFHQRLELSGDRNRMGNVVFDQPENRPLETLLYRSF